MQSKLSDLDDNVSYINKKKKKEKEKKKMQSMHGIKKY